MAISKVILNGVTQMDVTDTTATAEDVASGKVFYGADSVRTVGTSSGGGGEPVSRSDVNFYDYDGTLLHSYTVAQINNSGFTMPSNPSHTGLTAQGWNWTLAQLRTQLTAMPTQPVDVGQMYVTDDGKTRLYCHFEEGRLHPYLAVGVNGTVVVDWGDGSATDTLTGTSLTTGQIANHIYASGGDYIITLTVLSGFAQIYGISARTYLLYKGTTTNESNRVYSNALVKVELGTGIGIGTYAFNYCTSLASITMPSEVTSIGIYAFTNCVSLTSITIPSGFTSINSYAFQYCRSLASITIPSGVTSIGDHAFQYSYAIANITIPSKVTSIGGNAFSNCTSLANITIPSGVTSIRDQTFYYCYALTSITIPSGVTSIGVSAFYYCYAIASVTIPSGVTSIGDSAFQSCMSLANITIPSEVASIGNNAFSGGYGLGEIHFKSTTPPTVTNSSTWRYIQSDCKIYVPAGTLEAYTTATNYPSSSTYTYIEE